jgi:hypothetical protein
MERSDTCPVCDQVRILKPNCLSALCVGYIADDDFIFLVNQRRSFHLGHFYPLHRLYYLVKFVILFFSESSNAILQITMIDEMYE